MHFPHCPKRLKLEEFWAIDIYLQICRFVEVERLNP
jgi:hypothetical protein